MDVNPQDQHQMPPSTIKLKSSDGEIFEVEVKVAQLSLHIKEMLDELGVEENDVISIPQNAPKIHGDILRKIILWANHHKDDPAAAENDDMEVKRMDDISCWDAKFLQDDQNTLFQMIRAANYLNIQGLLDVTCKKLANIIKGKNLVQVRRRFKIQNDFSPTEEDQVREENSWADEFKLRGYDRDLVERIPFHSAQNLGLRDDQAVEDCFSNPIVLGKVFKHISSFELLHEFQFMNKMWNYEARSVMRKRGDVFARLFCGGFRQTSQEEVEAFGEHLRQMNLVPYSGMSIAITPFACRHRNRVLAFDSDDEAIFDTTDDETFDSTQETIVDSTREAILKRLPLKYLSVRLDEGWQKCKNCPTLLLVKKLLQDSSGVLEELALDIEDKRQEFIEHVVQDCHFPSLKVVKLQEGANTKDMAYVKYMKALVSRAERLQELHVKAPINLMHNVLDGREAVLVLRSVVHAPFERISDCVSDALRLTKLVMVYTNSRFRFERFNRITPMLLQASCTTLCSILTDAVFAVSLISYGICLKNVEMLEMYINFNHLERVQPEILRIVKNFDFTRLFPNVNKVLVFHNFDDLELSADHLTTIINQAHAVLREPAPDRTANVKELELELDWNLSDAAALYFAEMFSNIKRLIVVESSEQEIPFELIWKHWVDLEEFEVRGKFIPNTGNLDSAFCGIFPEEVEELRKMDEEYLKTVNIVPVMPAITCLNNLKTLKLNYNGCSRVPFVDDGTFIFSKVTALIAFAKLPALAPSLEILSFAVPPAMTYLEPYVSVRYECLIDEETDESSM